MSKSIIKFVKTKEVKTPSRGNATDAGIDFYVPEFDLKFITALKEKNPELFGVVEPSKDDINFCLAGSITISSSGGSYQVPVDKSVIKFDEETGTNYFLLKPQARVNIPSGIHCKMGEDRALIAFNKSGVASKFGLVTGACIDGDTIIETNKGKFTAKTLTKQFIGSNNILIKGYNETLNTYDFYQFDGFRITTEKESLKLVFDNGEELICSKDHLLLTNNGWKTAELILETDNLIQ